MTVTAIYANRRPDGWPLCPECGADELYSLEDPPSERTIRGCYACTWRPAAQFKTTTTVDHATGTVRMDRELRTPVPKLAQMPAPAMPRWARKRGRP